MLRLATTTLVAFCVLLILGSVATPTAAQDMANLQKALEGIEKSPMSEEQKQKARERIQKQMAARGGAPKPGQKKEDKKPDDKKKGDDKKKPEEKKADSGTVKRPDKPKKAADPKELEATPTNGKLILNFQGHPWPDMIDWYSRVTDREVEWQELPSGYVNLRTQKPMSLNEAGDLLNLLLLGRGFTMLDDGRFLQIVKTAELNPAFVPRVEPQELATMQPHGFVRTSFSLSRFKAEEVVKELETLKSKHGKLSAFPAANRIEAMDIVGNLRDIYSALDQEQTSNAPKEFVIRYLRAEDVKKKIGEMFGMAQPAAPMTPQQMQQMMQRRQQMQQQNKGKPPTGNKDEPKIKMIVNELKNSIIVKAPPHQMLDISDAIRLLDVKPTRDTLDIKAYPLATRTPEEVAEMLNESGALSPSAIIRVDKKTKTLLLSGTQFDHFRVRDLISRIDGNARRFVSVRLRRYPAVQVANTIKEMMGVAEDDSSRSRRRYYWWDDNEDDDDSDKFAVTADRENNRLILKCNDAEYEMVMELLTQMGEVLSRSKFNMNEVVLDDIDQDGEEAMLQRVLEAFKAYAPNQVILPPPVEEKEEPEEEPAKEDEGDADAFRTRTTMHDRKSGRGTTLLTQLTVEGEERPAARKTARNTTTKVPPPIYIERNAQGKLVLRSEDAQALEIFEELLRQTAPKTQDWVSFRMKHVTAYWMKLQLEDFFDEEEDRSPFFYWGWDDDDDKPEGLGDERKMRFIDDGESTLVVRNASGKQLQTVKELIELYDVSEPPNENNARYKKLIYIKFSRARTIETVLKDTFRDLLSSNDKAFEQKNKGGEENSRGSRRFYNPFYNDDDEGDLAGSTFKGKLSFGVDESTNILIITAQGKNLLDIVVDLVEELDQAAMPTDETRVVPVPASLNSIALRETLTKMFGPDAVGGGKKEGEQENKEGGEKPGDEQRRQFEQAQARRGDR